MRKTVSNGVGVLTYVPREIICLSTAAAFLFILE